jgi:hypothetical protein
MLTGIRRIQIYGERCSGTNFLERLLIENLMSVTVCRDFGWKHGFHSPDVGEADDCLFLVIYRNPFDWLRSLHRRPFHAAPPLRRVPFSDFIRREWWCVWDEAAHYPPGHEMHGLEMMSERDPATGERFPDVLRLRTAKIRNWEGLRGRASHTEYLRYEDLAASPSGYLESLSGRFGLERTDRFAPVDRARGRKRPYQPRSYKPIGTRDVRYIMERLEGALELGIGYDLEVLARDPSVRGTGIRRMLGRVSL